MRKLLVLALLLFAVPVDAAPPSRAPRHFTTSKYFKLDAGTGAAFEPSAVAVLGSQVLIVNDKATDLQPSVWNWSGNLLQPTAATPLGWTVNKIEALAPITNGYWALGSFSIPADPANRQLLRVLSGVVGDQSASLRTALQTYMTANSITQIKLEGLAYVGGNKWLLGVRSAATFVMGVLEFDLAASPQIRSVMWRTNVTDSAGRTFGLSSLEFAPNGMLYALGSYEGAGNTRNDVAGALWHLKELAGGNYGLGLMTTTFEGKPEGMTFLADGRLLVVFDEDGARKHPTGSGNRFPLDQDQDYFVVLKPGTDF